VLEPQAARLTPCHALSPDERAALLAAANVPPSASISPARNVPMMADECVSMGSESSRASVLKAHGQIARRSRAKAHEASRPRTTHIAAALGQVGRWAMTYSASNVMGLCSTVKPRTRAHCAAKLSHDRLMTQLNT
jgi:putative transposase